MLWTPIVPLSDNSQGQQTHNYPITHLNSNKKQVILNIVYSESNSFRETYESLSVIFLIVRCGQKTKSNPLPTSVLHGVSYYKWWKPFWHDLGVLVHICTCKLITLSHFCMWFETGNKCRPLLFNNKVTSELTVVTSSFYYKQNSNITYTSLRKHSV